MIGWGTALSLAWTLVSGRLRGGGLGDAAERIAAKLTELKDTKSEVRKAEIEREIVQIKAIADLQRPSSSNWFSPMMIGQYLFVVPYFAWFAAVCIVSILDPYTTSRLVILDLPPRLHDMANFLVPIILGGTILERMRK